MKRKKRVLMLTRLFPSRAFETNGTFCAERARALSRYADVRVMVPTPYWPSWLPAGGMWKRWSKVPRQDTTPQGLSVTYPRYVSIPRIATWSQGVMMARAVRKEYAKRNRQWRPDIIDSHYAFPDGYAAVKLAQEIGCQVQITCHGSDLLKYPPLPRVSTFLDQALSNADRVISVSSYLLKRSIELGCPPGRTAFLPNGVDTDRFFPRTKWECRKRLGLEIPGPLAVCVGYLIDRKNQAVLISALRQMLQNGYEPCHLALVGEGPNRQKLVDQARQLNVDRWVHFAGQRPYDEIPCWMGAADWLVLSSHYEGWATVYFESMACGRPVLTSDVPSARDAICNNQYGMVVTPNTPQAFADALSRAMQTQYDWQTIRDYALQHSWDRWAQDCMDLIEGRSPGTYVSNGPQVQVPIHGTIA